MLAPSTAPLSRRFGRTSDGRSRNSAKAATGCLPWDTCAGRDAQRVDIDARAGWVARFRKGQVTNFHTYADRADALDAVGLSE
jgi:hypothetical protein